MDGCGRVGWKMAVNLSKVIFLYVYSPHKYVASLMLTGSMSIFHIFIETIYKLFDVVLDINSISYKKNTKLMTKN